MEIDIESEATRLKEYWADRDQQIRADRDVINIRKSAVTTDKIRWYSNEPKVFYETATSLVSSYPPRFRLPLTIDFTPEQKDKMNKAERLVLGIFRSLDGRQANLGRQYWLREFAWWVLSGWYSIFTAVRRNEGSTNFIADLWDPITVYPEWDADGLTTCIRTYDVDKITAQQMLMSFAKKGLKFEFEDTKAKKIINVINYWLKDNKDVYNAIMLDGQEIKKLTKEDFDHIPIFVGAIGSPEKTSDDWTTRNGENIIAANRDMYEYDNQMASLMATIMAETAYPNMVGKSQSGAPILKGKMKGYGEVYNLKINEQLDLLKHAATPEEVNVLMTWVGSKKQKGSVPDIVYGGVPFELSGFAISQLMAAIRYKIAPYLNTMQNVISQIASEFLTQYKKGKFPKITLSTVNPREMMKGLFFVEEFSPADVPDTQYVEVTIPITSAMDKTQQMIYARQAMEPPQLISRETLWDEILDVQDSEQEYARIIQDQMLELPMLKQIEMIEQLRERETLYRNIGKIPEANALHQYIMALEMQLGMRQGIPETGKTGVPSQVSPPEMGNSPDMQRAATGQPPPSPNRLVNQAGEPF